MKYVLSSYLDKSNSITMWKAGLDLVFRLLEFSAGTRWYREGWPLDGGPLTFTFHPPSQETLNTHVWLLQHTLSYSVYVPRIQLFCGHSELEVS